MKLTFGLIDTLIKKIVAIGVLIILKTLLRRRYILKILLFSVLYWWRKSLVHITFKMKPVIMLMWRDLKDLAIKYHWTIFRGVM